MISSSSSAGISSPTAGFSVSCTGWKFCAGFDTGCFGAGVDELSTIASPSSSLGASSADCAWRIANFDALSWFRSSQLAFYCQILPEHHAMPTYPSRLDIFPPFDAAGDFLLQLIHNNFRSVKSLLLSETLGSGFILWLRLLFCHPRIGTVSKNRVPLHCVRLDSG